MNRSKRCYRSMVVAAAAAMAPLGAAFAAASPKPPEASIPFGLIRDWHADKDRGMWIQAYSRKWYYAQFMGPCFGLAFANTVGFDTRHQSSFDRWSSVFVPGYGRCPIQTFTPSEGPPRKTRKPEAAVKLASDGGPQS